MIEQITTYLVSQPPAWFLLIVVTGFCGWLVRFVVKDFARVRTRSVEQMAKIAEALRGLMRTGAAIPKRIDALEKVLESRLDRIEKMIDHLRGRD